MVKGQTFKEYWKSLRRGFRQLKEINQKIDYLIEREKIEFDPYIADLFRYLFGTRKKRKP